MVLVNTLCLPKKSFLQAGFSEPLARGLLGPSDITFLGF